MAILTPTKLLGATTKASDLVYVEPDRRQTDESLAAALGKTHLNAAFVADLLSAVLTHERCGRHLYRSVAGRTQNPVLRRQYEHFGEETGEHVAVLEELVSAMGGSPTYVSPLARAVEAQAGKLVESTFLLGGSADPMTREMVMLDAVFVAESVDRSNWELLGELCGELPDDDVGRRFREAVREVSAQEEEHLGWAADTRAKTAMLQARSAVVSEPGATAEEMVARVRNWFAG